MKTTFLFLLVSSLALIACNNKPNETSKDTTAQNSTVRSLSPEESASQIIAVPEKTPALIASRKWDLPKGNWEQAIKTNYADTLMFQTVKAAVIVKFTTLNADSSFIVSDLSIHSYREDNSYAITANISDQINMGTREAFNTYIMSTIFATLKPGRLKTLKLESIAIAAYAKDGKVDILD